MAIETQWLNRQQSAVLITFDGRWTWEIFYQAIEQAMSLFDTLTQPVPLIIDLTNSEAMPNNSIAHIRNAQGIKHEQMEKVIFVGMSTFMQMIGNLASRLNRGGTRNVSMVSTINEALQDILSTSEFLQLQQ